MSKNAKVVVTGCSDCLFAFESVRCHWGWYFPSFFGGKVRSIYEKDASGQYIEETDPPSWCPLRECREVIVMSGVERCK